MSDSSPKQTPEQIAEQRIRDTARSNRVILDLSDLGLEQLPAAIGQLAQLQRLSLSNNQLTELPAAVWQLTQLQRLWLNNNQLTELPAVVGQLTQLRDLDLDNNQLTELKNYQALPTKGKPVRDAPRQRNAWHIVEEGLWGVLEALHQTSESRYSKGAMRTREQRFSNLLAET